MKILYILKSLEKGGAERYVIDLCLELNKRPDINYKLLILQEGNDFEYLTKEIPYIQMKGPFIPSIVKKNKFDNSEFKKIVDEFQPDIIHSHLFRAELYTSTYVLKSTKYVVHGHDNMREFQNLNLKTLVSKPAFTNFYEKNLLRTKKYKKNKNTFFIANSNDTLSFYKKSVPSFLKQNVKLIQYGFNFQRFFNPNRNHTINSDKLKLINVGRFAIYKNQKFLIEIAKKLKEQKINFELNLLGVGEEYERIQSLIKNYQLSDCVYLRGNVDNVENWLNQTDIYLHSAYYEPFGLVLLEAMASGLPCIILNGKGNIDVVKNGLNGFVFDEEKTELFVNKINELVSNSELYKSLSINAQKFAQKFDIGSKTDELITFYKSIIK